jgi:aryl-alcohol dehydrogenase-like predicted oxidoreductase
MQYRRLGSSELVVSEIALGSWLTYGHGVDREASIACVDRALGLGVNLIDTANVYGRGAAEELLGEVLSSRPRGSYLLATKLYFPMSDEDRGLSAVQVRKQLDASLRRLRTEYVDLYQCHRYDAGTPLEETMGALTDAVRTGKVRYLGFSEWSVPQIAAALAVPGSEQFVSSQPQYSILSREPEHAVIPFCAEHGISQVVWSPLAQGVLTGKYDAGQAVPKSSRAGSEQMGWAMGRFLRDDVLQAVQRLRPVAADLGITMAQLALAWALREPNVAAAIVGASRAEQVEDNVGASGVELDESVVAAIDGATAGVVEAR